MDCRDSFTYPRTVVPSRDGYDLPGKFHVSADGRPTRACVRATHEILRRVADVVPLGNVEAVAAFHDGAQHVHLLTVPERRTADQPADGGHVTLEVAPTA